MTNLATIEQSLATLPSLGATVWWSLAGVEVQRADLVRALGGAGFLEYAPEPPTPIKALRRTLRAWMMARSAAGLAPMLGKDGADEDETDEREQKLHRSLIRVINTRRSKHTIFALIAEEVDLTQFGLRYGTELRIQLEKLTPQERAQRQPELHCTTEAEGIIEAQHEAQQITDELLPYWRKFQDLYQSGDLSRMVRAIVSDLEAVALRQGGGLYFVPENQRAALVRLQDLIATLPTDGKHEPFVMVLDVPDALEAKRQIGRAVHTGMLDEVRALDNELAHLQSKAVHGVQPATIAERLAKFRALRDKAQTYGDLLGMRQTEIDAAVTALTTKAKALLMSDELPHLDQDAEAPAEPAAPSPPGTALVPPPPPPSAGDDQPGATPSADLDDLGGLFDEP